MEQEYIVCSNLRRNGQRYAAGSTIVLDPSEAAPLIHAGTIQDGAEPADEAPETVAPVESSASVGGEPDSSGEPSIDGPRDAATRTEATDVSPVITDPKAAKEAAPAEAQAAKPGVMGHLTGKGRAQPGKAGQTQDAADPSAGL